ncbi:MAG TPA: PEP-CTERM sorting domain-containing protein [Pyrinomonadaceae bacterium]
MFRKALPTLATLFLLLAASATARADSILLQDNFDALSPGLYNAGSSTAEFNLVTGSIDVYDHGDFGLPCAGGRCVDLDGVGAQTTVLESKLGFGPGTYRVQFDLAGSQRGDTNTLVVSLADTSYTITLSSGAAYSTYSLFFTIPDTFLAQSLRFTHGPSGDNLGLLLDNVSVSSVDAVPTPEPTAMLLLGTGLAGIGASVRRLRKAGKGKVVS